MLRVLLLIAVIIAPAPACGDHSLLSDPVAMAAPAKPVVNTEQSIRRAPRAPQPSYREGDYWIVSVGQSNSVNKRAWERSTETGWGYYKFAPHEKCPEGVYLAVVRDGRLINTGDDPWEQESQNQQYDVRQPSVRQSAPVVNVVRYAQPAYYAAPAMSYAQPASYGSAYGSACSTGECGYSTGGGGEYYGAPAGYGYGASNWSSYSTGSFGSASGCASCGS